MKNDGTYIGRLIDSELEKWRSKTPRKPLLLRGARQVGKSSAVQNLGKKFDYFLELNFEKDEEIRDLFLSTKTLNPNSLCDKITAIQFQTNKRGSRITHNGRIGYSRGAYFGKWIAAWCRNE